MHVVLDALFLVLHLELFDIHVRLLGTAGVHSPNTLALAALNTGTLLLVAQETFLFSAITKMTKWLAFDLSTARFRRLKLRYKTYKLASGCGHTIGVNNHVVIILAGHVRFGNVLCTDHMAELAVVRWKHLAAEIMLWAQYTLYNPKMEWHNVNQQMLS